VTSFPGEGLYTGLHRHSVMCRVHCRLP